MVGHDSGWMSEPYLAAIQEADRCIGRVMEMLPEEIHYIVMADHGGHMRIHGTQLVEDMCIPVLAKGPSIQRGHALNTEVSILDVAPSILQILGIARPKEWMGTPLFNDCLPES